MLKYNLSYWEREVFFKPIDVAIIGSGLVGLAAAIHIKTLDPKLNVAVLERGPLPIGASTRNAGFACFGSMTELLDDFTTMQENAGVACCGCVRCWATKILNFSSWAVTKCLPKTKKKLSDVVWIIFPISTEE